LQSFVNKNYVKSDDYSPSSSLTKLAIISSVYPFLILTILKSDLVAIHK